MSQTQPAPFPLIDDCLFIDNSSLQQFMTCPRAAFYKLVKRRELASERAALQFGRIIHEALEVRYQKNEPLCSPQTEAEMIDKLNELYSTWSPPDGDFRTLDQATECILRYNKRYVAESFQVLDIDVEGNGEMQKAVELPFALPFCEIEINQELLINDIKKPDEPAYTKFISTLPVYYCGRIDLLVKHLNTILLADHKTTSIGGSGYFDEFYNAAQFKGYCWAVGQITGSLPNGYIINTLLNRKPNKSGYSIDFMRDTIYIKPEVVDEWVSDTTAIIEDFLNNYLRGQFPMHTQWCKAKYGKCEYFDCCVLPPAQRNLMLDSPNYRDWGWDPIDQQDNNEQKPTSLLDILS